MGVCTTIMAAEGVRSGQTLKLSPYLLTKIDVCFVCPSCPSPNLFYIKQCNLAAIPMPHKARPHASQLVDSPLRDTVLPQPSLIPFASTAHLSSMSSHLAQGSVTT